MLSKSHLVCVEPQKTAGISRADQRAWKTTLECESQTGSVSSFSKGEMESSPNYFDNPTEKWWELYSWDPTAGCPSSRCTSLENLSGVVCSGSKCRFMGLPILLSFLSFFAPMKQGLHPENFISCNPKHCFLCGTMAYFWVDSINSKGPPWIC